MGGGSIYNGIIYYPPQQIFKNGILKMESSDNLAIPWLTVLFNAVEGVNILWYNILTPLNDIKEWQFQSRIQLRLCFIILFIYISLMTQYQC